MKITRFVHSCLLVETLERVAVFDPGCYSTLTADALTRLDDILITHEHADHMDIDQVKLLRAKFSGVRITAPKSAADMLEQAGVTGVMRAASEGVSLFEAPHEPIRPFRMTEPPEEVGIHYLGTLTHSGDSHSFHETMPILALAVTAPWGSVVKAVQVALAVEPQYIIPVHDWHWNQEARQQMYDALDARFKESGITFIKPIDGKPFEINL